jgi:hypothetical protein
LLHQSATALENRAVFVYAAPVFAEARKLFHLQLSGKLPENSTFPEVRALTGHKSWYYNQSGATGIVNQDFDFVQGPSLAERILSLKQDHAEIEDVSPSQHLSSLASDLRDVALDQPYEGSAVRSAYIATDLQNIESYAERYEVPAAGRDFLRVTAITRRLNLEWYVVDERNAS